MMKSKPISSLIADEKQAVKDYGKKARQVKAPAAKVFRHIQTEEKHHARELGRLQQGIKNLGTVKSHGKDE